MRKNTRSNSRAPSSCQAHLPIASAWRVRARGAALARPGFTIIELSVVLAIIVLLISIVGFAARNAFLSARVAGERQACLALRLAVEQFKQQHGFLPPLLKDTGGTNSSSPINSKDDPVAFSSAELATLDANLANTSVSPLRDRYSVFSLTYYLAGATDAKIDGVDGPGYTEPRRDGTFSKRGKQFPALYDINKDRSRLSRTNINAPGNPLDPALQDKTIWIKDRWNNPIRYYRWLPTFYDKTTNPPPSGRQVGDIKDDNIPKFLGNSKDVAQLRTAEFAIVSAGPDGLINESAGPGAAENKDNIVEVGP